MDELITWQRKLDLERSCILEADDVDCSPNPVSEITLPCESIFSKVVLSRKHTALAWKIKVPDEKHWAIISYPALFFLAWTSQIDSKQHTVVQGAKYYIDLFYVIVHDIPEISLNYIGKTSLCEDTLVKTGMSYK